MVGPGGTPLPNEQVMTEIINLEREALRRWGLGDPDGFIEIMSPEVTYFDPVTACRIDGLAQLAAHIGVIRGALSIEAADLLNPHVVVAGDCAVLTFNLISRNSSFNDSPRTDVAWNSTEVFRRTNGEWRIVHSHWSFTTPRLAGPATM